MRTGVAVGVIPGRKGSCKEEFFLGGDAMEGARSTGAVQLAVKREFTESRLEQQVLMRTYELVVPVVRAKVASPEPSVKDRKQRSAHCEGPSQCGDRSQLIAKGA